jgi:threonine 3-dehydrogenase
MWCCSIHRIPDDWAAIMDPFGNATHTALSFPLLGEDVLITGSGPDRKHGYSHCQICRSQVHCGKRSERFSRLEIAKKMGATLTVNPSKGEKISDAVKKLGMRGFDIGLEMSGSPKAFVEMLQACITVPASHCLAFFLLILKCRGAISFSRQSL